MSVEQARIDWRDGIPHAPGFGDTYYSSENGLDEARAVFMAGCGLPDAWGGRQSFHIGELGFGSGLNALAVWREWRRTRAPGAQLVFVSIEAFPMRVEDAARAHAAFPEVADLSTRLRARWPHAAPGPQLISFPEDGFRVIVVHDAVEAALARIAGRFDAWFLDGFAPSRNPQMWSPEVMAGIAALSAPGARAATFSVAGAVRSALTFAGFAVEKRPGFGRKRERLEARLTEARTERAGGPFPRGAASEGRVLILGGGVAGCAMAAALRARGREAVIVSEGPAASLPPRALLTPRLENADRPHARALVAAFLHAARLYEDLGAFDARGARRLAADAAAMERLRSVAGLWPGLEPEGDALSMPLAGSLIPQRVLDGLARETPRIARRAGRIARDGGLWRLFDGEGEIASAPTLVLAGGASGAGLDLLAPLELGLSAGQLGLHRAASPPAVLNGPEGFIAPSPGGALVGATHDRADTGAPPAPDPDRQRALARTVASSFGCAGLEAEAEDIWTGVRAAAKDRLPCAGPVPDPAAYAAAFGAAARGGAAQEKGPDAFAPGLHVLTGLGSRGFAHAPLLAEAVAADLCGEPSPLESTGRSALHPARFLWRALKRGAAG